MPLALTLADSSRSSGRPSLRSVCPSTMLTRLGYHPTRTFQPAATATLGLANSLLFETLSIPSLPPAPCGSDTAPGNTSCRRRPDDSPVGDRNIRNCSVIERRGECVSPQKCWKSSGLLPLVGLPWLLEHLVPMDSTTSPLLSFHPHSFLQ